MTQYLESYHHGDLAKALMRAARVVIQRDGIEALTLRAVTREVGVSATAAVPHFGNLTGLRSALAAEGYEALAHALTRAISGAPRVSAHAVGMAYIGFALENPDLFRLMFRRSLLDYALPDLAQASSRAFAALRGIAGREESYPDSTDAMPRMAGLWARVHGLSLLAIDGMFDPFLQSAEAGVLPDFLSKALGEGKPGS
ncbi:MULTISPECIES: TetR/AcrR family transcriptional regulator [Asaia]|uniref:HTH tetR-type domain-containing protein n=1 Tax=Asaia bogorensis TaxID=91915 RepID=A0A060QJ56_9PROT|nr:MULTISPECIES: WHG domain-containing protein [Asaia]MDL2172140.1 WHG domain-containing protein [Asaia sp. HumB]CDG39276.1 hypothetical protein ASAP_1231 [Asaia bogorensis]